MVKGTSGVNVPGSPNLNSRKDSSDSIASDASVRDQSHDITWEKKRPVEALIFEGGGTKGLVYGGACKRLWQDGKLENVKQFAGTSAGAMAAALVAVGYNGEEMVNILKEAPFEKILDGSGADGCWCCGDLWRLMTQFGVFKGDVLKNFMEDKICAKLHKRNATFEDLWSLRQVHLKIGVTNVTMRQFEFLDKDSNPKMPISLAVRASGSLPVCFVPVQWPPNKNEDGAHYVDGGLLGNLPMNAFKPSENGTVLCFNLISTGDDVQRRGTRAKTLATFIGGIMETLVNASSTVMARDAYTKSFNIDGKSHIATRHTQGVDVVKINVGHAATLDTKMSNDVADKMIHSGWKSVHNYLNAKDEDRDLTFQCPPKTTK